jgi:hypothetical protein
MQRVSWEVDYDVQEQLRHPDDDKKYNFGARMGDANEGKSRAQRTRSQSVDLVEATRRYNISHPPIHPAATPMSPFTWMETEYASSVVGKDSVLGKDSRDGESFWKETESDSEANPPRELGDGERRWDIARNPFRDGVVPEAPPKAFGIEMKALGRSRSLQTKGRWDGR